jgi:stearoyl-CoA desaturase (Delta-9 desaturase)
MTRSWKSKNLLEHAGKLTTAAPRPSHSAHMQSVEYTGVHADRPRWRENLPFWGVHVAALVGAIYAGWSWTAFWWLTGTYAVRMFAITAGYHRYFSHRTYKTSRAFQLLLALLGMTTAQQGPLWWAAHHRRHHKYSDMPEDIHSPIQRGFIWSHMQWILSSRHKATDYDRIKDFAKYPELRFLNRHDLVCVVGTAVVTFLIGGSVALFWGFFVSVVLAWHITFCINSRSASTRSRTCSASAATPRPMIRGTT